LKPAPFDYLEARSVEEALEALASAEDSKALAGGQSLMPLLNFRLARPALLVDLNRIGGLAYLRREDGFLRIGAMTRQSVLERSAVVARDWPLLDRAIRYVAHPQIRNRGTVGGSAAHADPAAELPVALATLDARFRARSPRGDRWIAARDFFVNQLTSALEVDELLVEIEVPPVAARSGGAFVEFARRHGDFALGGCAVQLAVDADGAVESAALTLLGAAPTPLRVAAAEELLGGRRIDDPTAAAVADAAIEDVRPTGDIHGSSEYRRELTRSLVRRAVLEAGEEAAAGLPQAVAA
jgi:carbon-monoxide dehydrogenase medium subunit/6-hydroxypseudooxynicotine dehydrogenase subunit alpha